MSSLPFLDAARDLPSFQPQDAERGMGMLAAKLRGLENRALADEMLAILAHPNGRSLLSLIFAHSPFLSRLILLELPFLAKVCSQGPDACFENLKNTLRGQRGTSSAALMKALRKAKGKASLLIAAADIANVWPLEKVTAGMSDIAELSVQCAAGFLLEEAQAKGEIKLIDAAAPEKGSGLIILAMGKLGARELNYSSDIDLIILFERECVQYMGQQGMERFFPKLAQDLVRLLQERTADGYVFRTDLRLRPDPASTPAAMSTAGAITYYETVGQNWERAAFIKARPIAGDIEAGYRFLRQIAPFLWRKHLDFAAIADIQSIKRQMDARTGGVIRLPGHNVKTGLGGIREIEFFAQINQLIWGGREPALRISGTCAALDALEDAAHLTPALCSSLKDSYRFLRTVEHRLQMVDDQQTHNIPESEEARTHLVAFMGYISADSFEKALMENLAFVHDNFAQSFRGSHDLSSKAGKLSFTGVENDPQTVETLRKMGYGNPASVSEIIQSWHRGMRRSTRAQRARELITELTPTLLEKLAGTANPDQAFIRFDEFLSKLPAGVQLFSLFQANPQLLDLIAVIMGSAPGLAESLSKNPNLLDTVLTADFYLELPDRTELFDELSGLLVASRDFEDDMDIIRRFKNEKQFRAGIQLIRNQINAAATGPFLSDVADICVEALLHRLEIHFGAKQKLESGALATIALGRLGARELTFGSDIDLVFVYDGEAKDVFNRLSQRFIGALTALTREGRLYEVDTRLRPSGHDGLLAVSIGAFDAYLGGAAWTFELMAMTRARVVTGRPEFKKNLSEVLGKHLGQLRLQEKLASDITELRVKITREFGGDNPWNLKYAHGGLMDLDFIAQYFVLLHAAGFPQLAGQSTGRVFTLLTEQKLITEEMGIALSETHGFLTSLFVLLRLCASSKLEENAMPQGLRLLIAKGLGLEDFSAVKAALDASLAVVREYWRKILTPSLPFEDGL